MSPSDVDCDVSQCDSGNDVQYSWKNWNCGDYNFPDFPFDARFLGSSCIRSRERYACEQSRWTVTR